MERRRNQREPHSLSGPAPVRRSLTPVDLLALPVLDAPVTNPGITIEVQPAADPWPQVRRLSDRAVAINAGPDARWVIIESQTELRVSFADNLVESDDDDELT